MRKKKFYIFNNFFFQIETFLKTGVYAYIYIYIYIYIHIYRNVFLYIDR